MWQFPETVRHGPPVLPAETEMSTAAGINSGKYGGNIRGAEDIIYQIKNIETVDVSRLVLRDLGWVK